MGGHLHTDKVQKHHKISSHSAQDYELSRAVTTGVLGENCLAPDDKGKGGLCCKTWEGVFPKLNIGAVQKKYSVGLKSLFSLYKSHVSVIIVPLWQDNCCKVKKIIVDQVGSSGIKWDQVGSTFIVSVRFEAILK